MRFNRLIYISLDCAEFWQSPPPPTGRNGAAPPATASRRKPACSKNGPPKAPSCLWQKDGLGDGYSTPSIVGDRIFLINNKGLEDEFVQCLSVKDGSQIWQTHIGKVGKPDQKPSYPGARSTPTIDGKMLYALGSDGDLACMDIDKGKIRLDEKPDHRFRRRVRHLGVCRVAARRRRIASSSRPAAKMQRIIALNKKNGEVVKKYPGAGGRQRRLLVDHHRRCRRRAAVRSVSRQRRRRRRRQDRQVSLAIRSHDRQEPRQYRHACLRRRQHLHRHALHGRRTRKACRPTTAA